MEAKQHTVTSRMWLIPTPTKAQWRRLSLPQKLGCISAYFTVLSFVVVVLSFAWAIIFPGSKTIVRQKAETKGNNSPAIVAGSGATIVEKGNNSPGATIVETKGNNSPVIVTGPGATFNFPPAETMRKSVADALVSASKELDNKYPFGCVLFGAANDGKMIYKWNLKSVEVLVDWDNFKIEINPTNHLARIFIVRMLINTS